MKFKFKILGIERPQQWKTYTKLCEKLSLPCAYFHTLETNMPIAVTEVKCFFVCSFENNFINPSIQIK